MTRTSRYRAALFSASLLVSFALVSAHASAALELALARGDLDHGPSLDGWPTRQKYLTALREFLSKTGYL